MKQLAKVLMMMFLALVSVVCGCSKSVPEKGLFESIVSEFEENSASVLPYVMAAQDLPFTNAIPLYSQALEANDKCLEMVQFLSVVKAVESGNFADVSTNAVALILADPGNVEYAAVQFLCLQKGGDDAESQVLAEKINGQKRMTDYENEIWSIACISNYTPSVANQFTKRQLEFVQMIIRYKNSHNVVVDP